MYVYQLRAYNEYCNGDKPWPVRSYYGSEKAAGYALSSDLNWANGYAYVERMSLIRSIQYRLKKCISTKRL